MQVVRNAEEMLNICTFVRQSNRSIGFVPTMGCLHEGHLSLMQEARAQADIVVASIFVNPLQFGKNEDFGTYPRPLEKDVKACENAGVDIVFCPTSEDLYGKDFQIRIDSGALGKKYCGVSRPGFFDGVLTVVNLLLHIVRPDYAFFGEKDFQQLYLIKKLTKDFRINTKIIGLPIIREPLGLARSSRNEYLSGLQREKSLCIFRALLAGREASRCGEKKTSVLLNIVRDNMGGEKDITIDYVHIVDEETLQEIDEIGKSPARILIAAYIGENPRVRLIDNMRIN